MTMVRLYNALRMVTLPRKYEYLLSVLLIFVVNATIITDNDKEHTYDDSQDVQYIYDQYYESDLVSNYQYRDCIDHREYCYSVRHLCPNHHSHSTHDVESTGADPSGSPATRWMISHCPRTCQVCQTHQVLHNVPYEYTIQHEIETKIRLLPNDHNLYSKINPHVVVDTIRDAMTGKSQDGDSRSSSSSSSSSSEVAIGIQYLMSTTTALRNGVSYEQRNAMIRHVQQTQVYYMTTVVPMLRNITAAGTHNDTDTATEIELCRNKSPYCTYWAVVFDRCQDVFYHFVMSQHCPVTCQLCHERISHHATTIPTKEIEVSLSSPESIGREMVHNVNQVDAASTTTTHSEDDSDSEDETTTVSPTTTTFTTLDKDSFHLFDSKNCIYDPRSMPDVWYPHMHSVNQMFERIIAQYDTKDNRSGTNHTGNNINVTILSQPLLNHQHNDENQSPPWLIQIDNFLSDVECQYLIQLGTSLGYERSTGLGYAPLQPPQLPNQDTGNQKVDDNDGEGSTSAATNPHWETVMSDERTSSTTWCHYSECSKDNDIIQSIHYRIQNLTQVPTSHYESLQLLQYHIGQYYKSHHDYLPTQRRSYFGPRILTVLMYLSDVEDGGATHFPFLNITVRPKRGRIVLWSNVLHTQPNDIDLRMIHQALPVKKGVKFASNVWIHQREMHPVSCYVTEDEYERDDEEEEDDDDDSSGDDDDDMEDER